MKDDELKYNLNGC